MVACLRRGYKPETPSEIFPGVAGNSLSRYFDELEVDDTGRCDQCTKIAR